MKVAQHVKPFVIVTEHPDDESKDVIRHFKAAGINLKCTWVNGYGITDYGWGYHLVFGANSTEIKPLLKEVQKQLVEDDI